MEPVERRRTKGSVKLALDWDRLIASWVGSSIQVREGFEQRHRHVGERSESQLHPASDVWQQGNCEQHMARMMLYTEV